MISCLLMLSIGNALHVSISLVPLGGISPWLYGITVEMSFGKVYATWRIAAMARRFGYV